MSPITDDRLALFVQFTGRPSGSPISGLMVVRALQESGWRVHATFGVAGDCCRDYEANGCSWDVIRHGSWLGGGSRLRRMRRWGPELGALAAFLRQIRRLRPRLVYVNTIQGIAAVVAARLLAVPCVWHIRELFDDVGGEMHAPVPGGRRLASWMVRKMPGRVVIISEAVRENVLGNGCDDKVHVIPNAVSSAYFQDDVTPDEARDRLGLPRNVPLVGVPGTLRPVKGHSFFLDAAPIVARRLPDCHFAITGDGTDSFRAGLEHHVRQVGLTERVHFLGQVSDMHAFYRACDLACVPSRSESFGRTAIEAFAAGIPVVATAVGGMKETIEHDATGLLVPFGDKQALAESMIRLLEDRALRTRLADRARQEARSRYHEDVYHERIRHVVAELLNEA